MKLSVLLISILFGTMLLNAPIEAKTIIPAFSPENSCLPPGDPVITNITSVSAKLTWLSSADAGVTSYQWQIGLPGFTPGVNPLFSGSVTDTFGIAIGLSSSLLYEVHVRSVCEGAMFSDWTGPVSFQTAPGCGQHIYDPGGPSMDYQNNQETITTICPNVLGTVVSLDFTQFELVDGDSLYVFNGTSINDVLINTSDQNTVSPFTVTSSNPNGCLTVQFISDNEKTAAGYTADIHCIIPTSCFDVVEINVFNLSASGANFSWPAVFGALGYEWELVNIQTSTTSSGSTLGTTLSVAGLSEASFYTFRVRTLCPFDDAGWTSISFFTPINCANKPIIQCGATTATPVSASGQGIWQTDACGGTFNPTPGKERLFRFTAPNTRMYTFQTFGGSSMQNAFVTYAYKESDLGCGPYDWNCIGSFNVSTSTVTTFGPLIAGKEYLILFDAETTNLVSHSFKISGCVPTNDEAPDAIKLVLDSPCSENVYSNTNATFNNVPDLGLEPNPDVFTDGVDELSGRWLTSADETVWFKFKSPASGSVVISTSTIPQNTNFDTQLALYDVVDSSDYKSFQLIVSDEDNGVFGLGYNSVFSYSGLEPDSTYYIQVDGYGVNKGNFCIAVDEGVVRLDESECTPGYFVENVDGEAENGNHWYDIYSRPDDLDLGDLVIAVKPGMQNLDTVFCRVSVADTIPFSANHVPYLPAYYSIRSTKAPSEPYLVRLFFNNSEFDSLVLKSELDPLTTTIDQLVVTHYSGPNEDCFQLNNSYEFPGPGTGVPTLITDVKAVDMGNSNMFFVEFQVFTDGEVGVHLQQTVLPLELKSFTGVIEGAVNHLEWSTQTEKNVAWHILERSEDGVNWKEINRQAGQLNSSTPTGYFFDDIRPYQKSYYRLRSMDYDGQTALSSIVLLARLGVSLGIDRVYPSPTSNLLNVDFSTPEETDVTIQIIDITGRIVLDKKVTANKGRHSTELSMQALPSGTYIVTLSDGISVLTPVRVVKK